MPAGGGERVGLYAAELMYLADEGWLVLLRTDMLGANGPSITAEITEPCDAIIPGSEKSRQYTALTLAPQARREVEAVDVRYLRGCGKHLLFDAPLWPTDPHWLTIYAAWRDSYDGTLPHGWPFKGRASDS